MWLTLIATGAAAAIGCNAILGFGDYAVDADGGTSSSGGPSASSSSSGNVGDAGPDEDGGCIDPSGFGGRGCYRCPPTTFQQLQTACTNAAFEPFDNTVRIDQFDPQNPKPDLGDSGAPADPFDGGTSTSNSDAGFDPCPTPGPTAVIVSGSTGFPMDILQVAMGSEARIYYQETDSCRGIDGIAAQKQLDDFVASGGQRVVSIYDVNPATLQVSTKKCVLETNHAIDLGTGALFPDSCPTVNKPLPPAFIDELGPVNPVGFAAPASSSPERVISAEAAYRVYGIAPSGVEPWDDEAYIFKRRPSSGNQTAIALTLGLPIDKMRGRDSNGSSNMRLAISSSPVPAKTIGISSSDVIDVSRQVTKWLAYQHFGQPVGFYPDLAANTTDRRNVRDGHYFIWLSLHIFANSDGSGIIGGSGNNATFGREAGVVKKLAFVMSNRTAAPDTRADLFKALGSVGNVPQCAMKVTRATDGAELTPYTPPSSCGCAYENANGLPGDGCARCQTSQECSPGRPTCSFGFCE